jgi:hypothetical protein
MVKKVCHQRAYTEDIEEFVVKKYAIEELTLQE